MCFFTIVVVLSAIAEGMICTGGQDCLPIGIIGTVLSMVSALGEEIGWRGFMVPALLHKLSFNKMLVISSLVWCGWHLPLLIAGDYMYGDNCDYYV